MARLSTQVQVQVQLMQLLVAVWEKKQKNPEAQMDIDLEEDDLLGEVNVLSDVVHDFVGVTKGHSVDVRVIVT
jgi:hypothetical protein